MGFRYRGTEPSEEEKKKRALYADQAVANAARGVSKTSGASDNYKLSDLNLGEDAEEKTTPSDAKTSAAKSVASATQASGGAASKAGSGLLTYGAGTANPYAAAAGAGLMTYGAVKDKKQQEKMAEYNAEVDRLNREQNAMGAIAQLAQRFKSL